MENPEDMQEKLKNMTPEQLQEFQKQRCIFCQILQGKVPAQKVYEDDKCIGILDINPANAGHVLLLPKEHQAIMPLIPDADLKHFFIVAKKISHAQLKAFKADGTNIFVANGPAAGQKAQHFMIHIIPRKDKDDLTIEIPENNLEDSENTLATLAPYIEKFLKYKIKTEDKIETNEESTKNITDEKPNTDETKKLEDKNTDINLDNISDLLDTEEKNSEKTDNKDTDEDNKDKDDKEDIEQDDKPDDTENDESENNDEKDDKSDNQETEDSEKKDKEDSQNADTQSTDNDEVSLDDIANLLG